MKKNKEVTTRILAASLFVIAVGFCQSPARAANRYLIEDLGSLGGPDTRASGVNSHGQVVGTSFNAPGCCGQAFLFSGNGPMQNLTPLTGRTIAYAGGINDQAQVVGSKDLHGGDGYYHAFLLDTNTQVLLDLGTLPGDVASYGTATAIGGQAAGGSVVNATTLRAFRYRGATMQGLGSLGGPSSLALGINGPGEVVGWAQTPQTPANDYWNPGHAFLFNEDIDATNMVDLNDLIHASPCRLVQGPRRPEVELRKASAINDDGRIVGYGRFGQFIEAFLFEPFWGPRPIDRGFQCGFARSLGTFPNGGISYALALNDRGVVVGAAYTDATGAGNYEAFVWDRIAGMRNLNGLIPPNPHWRLREATGVNNSGQIVGWGELNGQLRAFRLTPQ